MNMKLKIQLLVAIMLLATGTLWLSSCSSDDVVQGGAESNADRVLLLSISTGQPLTRAAAESDLAPEEKAIEDMTVGIFNSDGYVRTIQTLTKDASASSATAGSGKFVITTDGKAELKIVTKALKAGDKIVVAVNTQDGGTQFKDIKSVADFNKTYVSATSALTGSASGTTLSAAKLPKYGEATLTSSNSSEFSANVKVKNLVSRVTLSALTSAFAKDGPYKEASFTPSEMFLLYVPSNVDFSQSAWTAQTASYFHGSDTDKTGYTASTDKKAFLTKTITAAGANVYLYTLPNKATDANKTILVIKGAFKKNTSDAEKTVYYPLALNVTYGTDGTAQPVESGTSAFQTTAGKNYKCNVTIKTIGSDSPWDPVGPLTATVDVEVEKWSDVDQATTFE